MASDTQDNRWLRHAFLLPISPAASSQGTAIRRQHATSAAYKFTNASLGGHYAMNVPPQFTRYADIRVPGRGRSEEDSHKGMGRYYSEAIDDPQQIIHFSFGVPQFSSWTSFFTNFYDRHSALLANTGRSSGLFYNAGLVGGYIVSLPLQPFIVGVSAVSRVYNFLNKAQPSKWYYFKPTMHSYWSSVNTIANDLAINMGLIPRVFSGDSEELREGGQISQRELEEVHNMFPAIWRKDGGIDVMSLARNAQRLSDHATKAERRMKETAENLEQLSNAVIDLQGQRPQDKRTFADAKAYFLEYVKVDPDSGSAEEEENAGAQTESFSKWSELEGIYSFIRASQRDGSQFVSFMANHNGAVSESFSNSTRDSNISQKLNQQVDSGRAASFDLMGGNVTSVIGKLTDSVQSFTAGLLDSVNLGGIATLAGTAFVDIPKLWDGSTANLPRAEYTIPLPNPYGNPMSRYINLMLPISMLLAGALPRSAGRSAYTSPHLCQVYHQGRVVIQLGMIDSLTITRGTGNVGWNAENDMLGAELTVSVVDMSSIMHVPIKGGFMSKDVVGTAFRAGAMQAGQEAFGDGGAAVAGLLTSESVWDERSVFSDYMATLSSLSLDNMYYVGKRLNLNMTRTLQSFKTWKSPSNFMSWVLDGQPARTLSGLSQYSERFNE